MARVLGLRGMSHPFPTYSVHHLFLPLLLSTHHWRISNPALNYTSPPPHTVLPFYSVHQPTMPIKLPSTLNLSLLPASSPHTPARQYFLRGPSTIFPSSRSSSSSSSIHTCSSPRTLHLKTKPFVGSPSISLLNCHHHRRLSLNTNVTVNIRTMSSSTAPAKKEFLCILPDFPGVQAKRLEVRP